MLFNILLLFNDALCLLSMKLMLNHLHIIEELFTWLVIDIKEFKVKVQEMFHGTKFTECPHKWTKCNVSE